MLLLASCSLHAAPIYVDNQSNCAGLTVCYTTIQEAVNNAVADDQIRVFPGVYPELVDISLMGSAIGPGIDGNIGFITVDVSNAAVPGTAQVSPATGSGFTHTGATFDGDVMVDGFVLISTDDDGIDLDLVNGDIVVRNVTASGNFSDGIDLEVADGGHTIAVHDSIANNNGSSGLNLDGPDATVVIVSNVLGNENVGEGIIVNSVADDDELSVSIFDSGTLDNGTVMATSAGVAVITAGVLDVRNLNSSLNRGPGLVVFGLGETSIADSNFDGNGLIDDFDGILFRAAGTIAINRSAAKDNGSAGIWASAPAFGMAELTELNIECSSFSGNKFGVVLRPSLSTTASYSLHQSNLTGQSVAGIHAGVAVASIDATNNWWGSTTGPTHSLNAAGDGDQVSDVDDDVVGDAQGTVNYLPFSSSATSIAQYPSDALFVAGFEGNACTLL